MSLRLAQWAMVIFLAFIVGGCAGVVPGNRYLYTYSLASPASDKDMTWEDDKILATFDIGAQRINFKIKNKTDSALKIIWDEASIIQFGKAKKVMHMGVKYSGRNESQPPTVIPPSASIDDAVLPADNVWFREGVYSRYGSAPGGWEEHDLFLTDDRNSKETEAIIMKTKGMRISLYLPIQQKEQTTNYKFDFVVDDVQKLTKKK